MTNSEAVMFQFFGGVTVLWAVLLAIFAGNKRRLKLQMRSIITLQRRRPEAHWQAGRWDTDERHAYVANLGDDTAYDVTIAEEGRVIGTAPIVPPFRTSELSPSSSRPCYLNFCIHADIKHRVAVNSSSAPRAVNTTADSRRPRDVAVMVTWRAENGTWSTQRVHIP